MKCFVFIASFLITIFDDQVGKKIGMMSGLIIRNHNQVSVINYFELKLLIASVVW